jgi:hypothetical protein
LTGSTVVSNERTQDNQVQEGNNNVNMEDNKTKRKKKKNTHCLDAQEEERNGMIVLTVV